MLTPFAIKTYETEKKSGMTHHQFREIFTTVGTAVRAIQPIASPVINAISDTNVPVEIVEDSLPSNTFDRPPRRRRTARSVLLSIFPCCNIQ